MSTEDAAHHEVPNAPQSSSSSSSSKTVNAQEQEHDREVLDLVRRFTSQSEQQNHGSPFTAAEGSRLDPKSEHFRAKEWARAFYDLRYSSDDLNVWGKGSPTDFQATVGTRS
ncbi:hypothetical protein GQ44DRAFT_710303 [Phaeosphaeriaceae sp. PMI808]|nr:hypothetical protein GQ44DRAFT_710303 [Phaeosphaeriaceae sp. PMI808]